MQHLREMNEGLSNSRLSESHPAGLQEKVEEKGKVTSLEEGMRESSLDGRQFQSNSELSSNIDDGLSSYSSTMKRRTYQDMQDVPDEIAGFQPNMDPRLREALEALEDDDYVDEQTDEDYFGALTQGGQGYEINLEEFEETQNDEDEGWESDTTEKAPDQVLSSEFSTAKVDGTLMNSQGISSTEAEVASAEDGDWLRDLPNSRGMKQFIAQ